MGDHHAADKEAPVLELRAEPKDIHVIGDAVVGPHLVLLYVIGTDDNDDLRAVAELLEHPQLAVRLESRQDPAGVVVVKQFASKLKIELVPELGYAFLDVF